MPCDDDVLRQRRQRGDAGDAHGADADPGAGPELEILGDAAVEEQAAFGAIRIGKGDGVADQVEALGVEPLRSGVMRRFKRGCLLCTTEPGKGLRKLTTACLLIYRG